MSAGATGRSPAAPARLPKLGAALDLPPAGAPAPPRPAAAEPRSTSADQQWQQQFQEISLQLEVRSSHRPTLAAAAHLLPRPLYVIPGWSSRICLRPEQSERRLLLIELCADWPACLTSCRCTAIIARTIKLQLWWSVAVLCQCGQVHRGPPEASDSIHVGALDGARRHGAAGVRSIMLPA